MKNKRPDGIKRYDHPAGVWDALKPLRRADPPTDRRARQQKSTQGQPAGGIRLPRLRMARPKAHVFV